MSQSAFNGALPLRSTVLYEQMELKLRLTTPLSSFDFSPDPFRNL